MSQPQYRFTVLPHDEPSVQQWAPKFIEYRLRILKEAPESFSSSHKIEASISNEEWISMLCEPAFRVVIGVHQTETENTNTPAVWDNEWIAIICLYGPRCLDQPQHENADDCTEFFWFVGGLFVSPPHRGQKMLRKLFSRCEQEAVKTDQDLLQKRRARPESGRFRTRVLASTSHKNPAIWNYYCRACDFEITQVITLAEREKWGMNIFVSPEKLGNEIIIFQKIISWETGLIAQL